MANDNTLGAPTEGLGQTVTFAAGGQGRTPQQQPVQRQALRAGASGGGAQLTAQALQIPPSKGDATFQVLAKLGGDLLKPHLEAERTAAYFEGMQRASSDEALKEVIDEQPWYSKLFGPTSLVDGARAGAAAAKALSVAVDFETNMKEYRQLAPQEFAKAAAQKVAAAHTGDAITDMMITQQAGQSLPQVMKNQTKEHLRFKQEKLVEGMKSSLASGLALIGASDNNARNPDSATEQVDTLGAAINVVSLFQRPDTIDPKLHDGIVGDTVIQAVSQGNFAAYNLLETSGKLGELAPDVAYRVRRAKEQASSAARMNVSRGIVEAEAAWLANRDGKTEADILAGAEALNKRYTAETGDNSPYVPKTATVRELVQHKDAELRRLEAERRELGRITDAATKEAKTTAHLYAVGERLTSADGYYIGDVPKKDQQAYLDHVFAVSPGAYYRVLANQHARGVIHDTGKDTIAAGFAGAIQAKSAPMFAEAYKRYAALVEAGEGRGAAVANTYAGEFKEQAAIYHRFARGRALPEMDANVAFLEAINPPPAEATGKFAQAVEKELTSNTAGSLWSATKRVVGGDEFPVRDPRGLRDILVPVANKRLDPDDAVEAARARVGGHPSLTELGGYHWLRLPGTTDPRDWFERNFKQEDGVAGVTSKTWNRAFVHTVDKVAEAGGIVDGLTIKQYKDNSNKVPVMYMTGTGSDGQWRIMTFTAEDMHRNWIDKQKSPPSRKDADIIQSANPAWGTPN